jgi:hypothetical protein
VFASVRCGGLEDPFVVDERPRAAQLARSATPVAAAVGRGMCYEPPDVADVALDGPHRAVKSRPIRSAALAAAGSAIVVAADGRRRVGMRERLSGSAQVRHR